MNTFIGLLVALVAGAHAAVLRDVPLGECHGCEVTCFEDCSLKYDREIMQADLLQMQTKLARVSSGSIQPKTENNTERKLTKVGREYIDCLQSENCPCPKEEAKNNGTVSLLQNATCAVQPKGAASCAAGCSMKVVEAAHAKLEAKKKSKTAKKQVFLQKAYPIHSVQVGIFSRGAMNMDQCLKFCLAATCGCDKAPGLDTIDKLVKAIKQNDAANPGEKDFSHRDAPDDGPDLGGAVADTHKSYKFRPAKIEECAKGMIGKKVSKGLYIDMGGGVGGELEICSKPLLERIFGPGDHSKMEKMCKSTKSDDSKWGCVWDETKGYCGVGFSPNLRCLKRYINDPTRL